MGQLDTDESGGIGRDGSGESRAEAREEGLEAALAVQAADDAANSDVALSSLQAALDSVDREDRDPHGNTSSGTGHHDGRQAQLALGLARDRIGRGKLLLDDLVCDEVSSRAGAVAGQGSGRATEDGANTALAVQLANDVQRARVLGLFAGSKFLLTLDLKDDLDTLKWCSDGGHRDGREEAGKTDLAEG